MKILIAVDDSSHSQRAVEFVAGMRWPPGSRMLVSNVARETAAPEAQHSLITVAQNRLRDAGLSTEQRALEGDAREQLLRLVENERVDLLVMGSRGCGALPRSSVGSVSSHAVAHASCSVLVVRKPQRRYTQPGPRAEKADVASPEETMKIVIGVDDSAHSRAAVEFVRRMPWSKDTEVVVLSVFERVSVALTDACAAPPRSQETAEDPSRHHQEAAETAARTLETANLTARSLVDEGDPRTTLTRAAQTERADLVVVGSHGRTGLAQLVIGSVANYVASHAPCSVLVVKLDPHGRAPTRE